MKGATGDSPLDPARLDELWSMADPDGTAARLREETLRHPPGSLAAGEVSTQLARALGLSGDARQAHEVLDGITDTHATVAARVHLERGRLALDAGDTAAATASFRAAVADGTRAGRDDLVVDALHMLAIGDEQHAEDWAAQALTATARSTDPRVRRWRGPLHNNLGWTLHDRGDHAAALGAFRHALTAFEEHGTAEQIHVARWTLAHGLRLVGRPTEALEILERLRNEDPPDPDVADEIALARADIGALPGTQGT